MQTVRFQSRWKCLLLLAFIGAAAYATDLPDPDTLTFDRAPGFPSAWVSLQRAVTPSGELQLNLLGPADSKRLGQFVRTTRDRLAMERRTSPSTHGCDGGVTVTTDDYFGIKDHDLDTLVASARTIVEVTVLSTTPGFLLGNPGTLLTVTALHYWKAESTAPPDILFLYYPNVRTELRGVEVCRNDPQYSFLPTPGGRYLTFLIYPAVDTQHLLYAPGVRHWIDFSGERVAASSQLTLDHALLKNASAFRRALDAKTPHSATPNRQEERP